MSQPFRILELTGSNRIGGVETYLLRLGDFLQSRGHEVLWATREGKALTRELQARGHDVHPFYRASKWNPTTLFRLVQLLKSRRVDAIHTHIFAANSIGARAARLAKIPSIARVPAAENAAPYFGSTYVTAVSKNVARHIAAQGVASEKIRVFYNGVETARFADLPEKEAMRARFGVPQNAFCAVCAASFTPRKGQKFLLEAAKNWPDLHVLLAGEGGEEAALRAFCETHDLRNRVHFAGFLRDVREALAAGDAFVLPSSLEGLPNAVLEAQAAGMAVVATDVAGTSEIVRDGQTGFLVPPRNSAALADALGKLRAGDVRRELGKNAQKMARDEFESALCLEKFERFVGEVVTNWRNGRALAPADSSWQ